MLTDREMMIAGFCHAAGAFGVDLKKLREQLEKADKDGAFDKDETPCPKRKP
jgi:hypothetical protein